MDTARVVCTVAAAAAIIIACVLLLDYFDDPLLALAVGAILTILFVVNSIREVPANPPHKGVLLFLRERQEGVVLEEGWNWVPFYPFVFDFILVKVEKVNQNLESQEVRTPDKAEISVRASATWKAGIKGSPRSYITYLDSGGEEGVRRILHDIIEDREKTWAGSNKEGPSTWMEAQVMKDDIHVVLAKSLLGDALTSIPEKFQRVPTGTWMRFLDNPQSEPTKYDTLFRPGETPWATKDEDAGETGKTGKWNWDGLQAIFDSYSQDEREELKAAIKARRDDVRKIREGKGEFGDESLGITIIRFAVNEVKVLGKVAEAAEQEEKERREMAADKMEIDNVSDRVAALVAKHPGLPAEIAFQIVQVERGKVSKTVLDFGLQGLSGVAKDVAKEIVARIKSS